jgi:hypothetical protein
MKTNTRIILLILVLLAATLPARGNSGSKCWDRFHIWQNLDTSKKVTQPAFLQLTFPDEGEKSLVLGLGLKYDVVPNGLMDLGFFAEYSRNTQKDKEQDVLKAGMAMEWQIFKLGQKYLSHSPILIAKINYKRDGIKDTGSLQGALAYTHVFKGRGDRFGFPLPNTTFLPKVLAFTYSPLLGLEYEKIYNSGAGGLKGDVLRGYFQLEAALYPLAKKWKRKLELELTYIYRRDITNSISEMNRTYKLLKTGISWYILTIKKMWWTGIGLTYVNGEDPSIGLEKQKYLQIGLKLKVN